MNKIITVSREFGSGGRELGKRLAEHLGFAYYDKEVLAALAEQSQMDEKYLGRLLEGGSPHYFPITYGRSFTLGSGLVGQHQQQGKTGLLSQQQRILRDFAAKSDSVIVGRGADYILREWRPFSLFVYGDMPEKLARCRQYASEEAEELSDKKLLAQIRRIDKSRAQLYELISGGKWAARENYQLCLNTTGISIKEIVPWLAEYILHCF